MTIKAILFDKDGTLFHFNETWGPWFYDVLLELSDGKHDFLVELSNLLKYDYKTKTFYKNSPFIAGTRFKTKTTIKTINVTKETLYIIFF